MNNIFRGKRCDNLEWVEGNLIQIDDDYFINSKDMWASDYKEGTLLELDCAKIFKETIGVFTGLISVKGQKAFTDDIIKFTDTEGRTFIKEISWSNKLQSIMIGNLPYEKLYESGYIQPSKLEFEILGNLIDNPDGITSVY